MTEWQPIETAPRDGRILAADARTGYIGLFSDIKADPGAWPDWCTHWMPLPDPPNP